MDKNDPKLLDLTESTLLLEGDDVQQKKWSTKIDNQSHDLEQDRGERKNIYIKRKDFYTGNQGSYSNITGIIKDTKQKKGHTNQITNYAGKTVVKIALGIANNPPKLSTTPQDPTDDLETVRAKAVQEFQDAIFKENKFWNGAFRRAAFHQSEFGDAAIKTYPETDPITGEKKICITVHEDLSTLSVGWNGEPGQFDFVIAETLLTPQAVYDKYGIKVNEKALKQNTQEDYRTFGSWEQNNQWGTKPGVKAGTTQAPSGKTQLPKARVVEYDSEDVYAIKIENELVSLVFKDGKTFPRTKFWTIIPNIPNPPSPWSIADIDYLMDSQIELNENNNRSSDHLRVGNVQRYVAYNMNDFDPESIKTSSGQVIFVNDPDGKARFEPLQTNINNFPDDQYHNRTMGQLYDMGLPKVNYGGSQSSSGRSKAIDYQTSIDLTDFKRGSWEMALQDVAEKIQTFGNFLFTEVDWFTNADGKFILRDNEFDWTDILPISASDKIVNVANKYNMIGISLKTALKELGYRNPEAEIAQIKKELQDPTLMMLRAKAWQLSPGLISAETDAQAAQGSGDKSPQAKVSVSVSADAATAEGQQLLQDVGLQSGTPSGTPSGASSANQPSPTLNADQNSGSARPMASKGGTTSYSSAQGLISKTRQNLTAEGR